MQFLATAYLRLSYTDDHTVESDSITNQMFDQKIATPGEYKNRKVKQIMMFPGAAAYGAVPQF